MDFGNTSAVDLQAYNADFLGVHLHHEDIIWLCGIQAHQNMGQCVGRRDSGALTTPLFQLLNLGLYNLPNDRYWSWAWQSMRQYTAVVGESLWSLIEVTREQVSCLL